MVHALLQIVLCLISAIVNDLKDVFVLLIFVCLRYVSCMHTVASFSGLSIYHCYMLSYCVYDILNSFSICFRHDKKSIWCLKQYHDLTLDFKLFIHVYVMCERFYCCWLTTYPIISFYIHWYLVSLVCMQVFFFNC
jgi:hypothetical protein